MPKFPPKYDVKLTYRISRTAVPPFKGLWNLELVTEDGSAQDILCENNLLTECLFAIERDLEERGY